MSRVTTDLWGKGKSEGDECPGAVSSVPPVKGKGSSRSGLTEWTNT